MAEALRKAGLLNDSGSSGTANSGNSGNSGGGKPRRHDNRP
jgi:hypothetical protein